MMASLRHTCQWSFSDNPLHNDHVFQVPRAALVHRFDCRNKNKKNYILFCFVINRKADETISIRLKGNDVNVFLLDSFGKEVPVTDVDLELELPARFKSHSRLKSRLRQLIQRLKNIKDGTKMDLKYPGKFVYFNTVILVDKKSSFFLFNYSKSLFWNF